MDERWDSSSRGLFRDASLQADLETSSSPIEEKAEGELQESKAAGGNDFYDFLCAMAQRNGICYKFFYDHNCPDHPNCKWSHDQADFDKYWEKVATDFFRMAGPRLEEAHSQGKLYEFMQSLKPMPTGPAGPRGQPQRGAGGPNSNRYQGGGGGATNRT